MVENGKDEHGNFRRGWQDTKWIFLALSVVSLFPFACIIYTFFLSFNLYRDSLGWAVLLNFLVYITIPVVLQYTGILLGVGSFAIYVNTIIGLAKKENYFWEQVIIQPFWWIQIPFASEKRVKFEYFHRLYLGYQQKFSGMSTLWVTQYRLKVQPILGYLRRLCE